MDEKTKRKLLVVIKAILMNTYYRARYQEYIDAKRKAHGTDAISVQKAWFEIVGRWGFPKPIPPFSDVEKIPQKTLAFIYFMWRTGQGAVLLNLKVHRQLAGKDKVQAVIPLSIDLTYNKTRILRTIEGVVKTLQANRKRERGDVDDIPKGKKNVLYFNLGDFDTYELCDKLKGKNVRVPFYKVAKRESSRDATSEELDAYAKWLEDCYGRAKWLIGGGYKVLVKQL